ncbi:hypothetical protein [Fluviicola taffensis]|uniref:Transmembrane protein n=1 Tax=Fluviicola taffensis (strain DSM 16823 / NCIMB 13979 / RW262) TaxID=755732 RepID=F2ICQ4_FLUTR|nr:hypothetical protein [Fluviicola taffensis]AEA42281.1 hypothetical protein Fluta_0272 [Fluviicola taffensis DSM 16823]
MKKTLLTLVGLSLLITTLVLFRVNFVKGIRSWESKLLATLIGLAAITMLYIAYKAVIKRFSKGMLQKEDYALLFDLEGKYQTGILEFYFTIEKTKNVVFSILNAKMEAIEVVQDKEFPSGGHIIRYDTKGLDNGVFFYCLETDNQKTMKKIHVQHDNLTV